MNREAHAEAPGMTYGIGDLANTFFRHKKKALFFSLSVVALATLIILYAPRKYRSEARLFLQVGRESIRLDPSATTGKTIALQQAGRDSEIATSLEVLRSRAILEKAVDRLTPEVVLGEAGSKQGAEPNPVIEAALAPLHMLAGAIKSIDPISKREEAVILLERNFEVDAEHDSTVIALTFDAESAALAQEILKTLVAVYQEEHVRLHQTNGSKPFFAKQRDELEKQLVAAENALREAKNRMGVGSIESRRSTVEQRLASVEQSRNGVIQSQVASLARIEALKSHIDKMPERTHASTSVVPNTGADALRSQLYTLQVELMKLEATYSGDHPLVKSKRSQVDEAKVMLAGESGSREVSVDSVNENQRSLELQLAQAESTLAGDEAQLAELESQQATAMAELRTLNDYEVEIQELDRTATLARNNFYGYAEDLEHVRVDEELDQKGVTNVAVAQEATLNEKPISPSKLLVCALSLLMATAGTTALVLGSERFDSRLRSEDQAEQVLRLPVLASVPEGRAYALAAGLR